MIHRSFWARIFFSSKRYRSSMGPLLSKGPEVEGLQVVDVCRRAVVDDSPLLHEQHHVGDVGDVRDDVGG